MRNIKSLCLLVGLSFTLGCTSYEEVPRSEEINSEVDSLRNDYYRNMIRAYWDSTGGFPNLDSLYIANESASEKKYKSED